MRMSEETKVKATSHAVLIVANLVAAAFIGITAAVTYGITSWFGISWASGFITGMCFFFIYARLKLGHWI